MTSSNTSFTIDIKHDQMMEYFSNLEDTIIPNLIREKENLKEQIKSLQKKDIDKKLELQFRIKSINNKIKQHKNEKNNYFLENSKYIFSYFEEKQKINTGENSQNNNVINSFFKIKSANDEGTNIQNNKYSSSRQLYQNYWKNINEETLLLQDFTIECDTCYFL